MITEKAIDITWFNLVIAIMSQLYGVLFFILRQNNYRLYEKALLSSFISFFSYTFSFFFSWRLAMIVLHVYPLFIVTLSHENFRKIMLNLNNCKFGELLSNLLSHLSLKNYIILSKGSFWVRKIICYTIAWSNGLCKKNHIVNWSLID